MMAALVLLLSTLPLSATTVHLLADPDVVAAANGAAITLGPVEKSPRNPVIREDRPWEGAFGNCYPTAAYDPADRKVKLWLNARTRCPPTGAATDPHTAPGICPHLGYPEEWKETLLFKPSYSGQQHAATLYVEADEEGLAFTKPALGLHSWNGSTVRTPPHPNTPAPRQPATDADFSQPDSRRW